MFYGRRDGYDMSSLRKTNWLRYVGSTKDVLATTRQLYGRRTGYDMSALRKTNWQRNVISTEDELTTICQLYGRGAHDILRTSCICKCGSLGAFYHSVRVESGLYVRHNWLTAFRSHIRTLYVPLLPFLSGTKRAQIKVSQLHDDKIYSNYSKWLICNVMRCISLSAFEYPWIKGS